MMKKTIAISIILAGVLLIGGTSRADDSNKEEVGIFQAQILEPDLERQSLLTVNEKRIFIVNGADGKTNIVTPAGKSLSARSIGKGDWVAVRGFQYVDGTYRMSVIKAQTIYLLPRKYSPAELNALK